MDLSKAPCIHIAKTYRSRVENNEKVCHFCTNLAAESYTCNPDGTGSGPSYKKEMYGLGPVFRIQAGLLTSVVELGDDYPTACPCRENKACFEHCEYSEAFCILQHLAWDDTVKTIITLINKRLD